MKTGGGWVHRTRCPPRRASPPATPCRGTPRGRRIPRPAQAEGLPLRPRGPGGGGRVRQKGGWGPPSSQKERGLVQHPKQQHGKKKDPQGTEKNAPKISQKRYFWHFWVILFEMPSEREKIWLWGGFQAPTPGWLFGGGQSRGQGEDPPHLTQTNSPYGVWPGLKEGFPHPRPLVGTICL